MNTAAPHLLTPELLQQMAAQGGVRRYPAHAVIINEGDAADSLFIIISGKVKVYAANAAGKEVIINMHGPGEYVGEIALDGGGRSASVMTLEPTACTVVTGDSLRAFIVAHPDFGLHLIHHLIRRVRGLTGNVKSLALDDVYSRLAALLERLSVADGEQRVVEQRLTQQDIADHIGASREMVSRILKELATGGYVRVTAGRIRLLKKLPAGW